MKSYGIKFNVKAERIPYLEIGDNRKILSEETIKKGNLESLQTRGQVTFISDGSKCAGTREMQLGEPIYRVAGSKVDSDEVMFRNDEYFAR